MTDALASLSAKLSALVTAQKSHPWTSPALSAKLDAAQASVTKIGATVAASAKVTASVAVGAGGGVKTDALSLGVGVSAKTAAGLKAGISLGVGFSASASVAASFTTNLNASVALVAGLDRQLATLNTASAAIAGPNGVMPPGRTADSSGVDSALRDLGSKLDESQAQAVAQAPPVPKSPLTAEIRMSRIGAWQAELATDDEAALAGKISFTIDQQTFVGTVLASNAGIDGSRARCRVVAGNGKHDAIISGKSYTASAGVKVSAVLRDILHDCGEDLSDLSDGGALDQRLPRWHVSEGPANEALTDLATKAGCGWRFLRDGTVWFGPETWPEVTPDHRVVDEDWSAGALMLAPDQPDMVPGVVFQGQRIEQVIHHLGTKLRTEVRASHPAAALNKFLSGQRRDVDYSREWPCRVVTQNPDGSLQLLPDDDVMKARGLDHVSIRYPFPGMRVKVKAGARCHLSFAAGDPSRPFAHNWESGDDFVDSIEITAGGRTAEIARKGDPIQVFVQPGVPILINGSILMGGVTPTPIVPGTFITIVGPLPGVIQTGNPKFKG